MARADKKTRPGSRKQDDGRAAVARAVRQGVAGGLVLPRLSPHDAVAFGRELLRGAWTLAEHFEQGDRCYFVWRRSRPPGPLLTRREELVLLRAAAGAGDRSLAMEMGCSPSTVATHRLRAMSKLGVDSRTLLAQVLAALTASGEWA